MLGLGVVVWALTSTICSSTVSSAHAQSLKVRVRGSAKIVAHASRELRDQGDGAAAADGRVDLVLSGSLADDAGQPLGGEKVAVRVTRESDPRDPAVLEGLRAPRSCDRGTDRPQAAYAVTVSGPPDSTSPPEVIAVTDESGRFCLRVKLVPDRHQAQLSWRGSSLLDAADSIIAFDLSRRALVLRFDPTPRIVALDTPKLAFEAAALVEDDGTTHAQRGLRLTLAREPAIDGGPQELATAETDSSGRARFSVDAPRLGPPGKGELRVSFAGDRETAFATHVAEIERHVKVTLRVPAAERGELVAAVPEDGIPLIVDVGSTTPFTVNEGGVEARVGDAIVGAAPVERGIARLTLTFTAPAGASAEAAVRLRYVASSPWYEPLGEPVVKVPIRGPGLLSKAPILAAGLAVLAFFLMGRVASRTNKPEPAAAPAPAEARVGKPRMDVVRAAVEGETGWRGRIVDAHEGTPVAGARVWIERGSFEGRSVLASIGTGARGEFELPDIGKVIGDEQMAVEAPLHARLVQPLPPRGDLSIALVLRRRALLARLVSWAKRRGKPFDVKPEPTPGHVRRAAAQAGDDFQTARWADAIEKAVFGGGEVDARMEREIERMAPSPGAGPDADEPGGARKPDPK